MNIRSNSKMFTWVLFFLLWISGCLIEASLVNPDLAPELPGYEDFSRGSSYFFEENWEAAVKSFNQAIKQSHKPRFRCSNYLTEEGDSSCQIVEDDVSINIDDLQGFSVRDTSHEIAVAIYRHSHFYLGLIRLQQEEFDKANLHFKKAIGFNGYEDKLGSHFYKCANIINPSWIALASLTRLQTGKVDEANELIGLSLWTLENFDYLLTRDFWRNIQPKYWKDLNERGITTEKWSETQLIIHNNTASIIVSFQNDLESAIDFASQAIHIKDFAIERQNFSEESIDQFVLHHNRGFYSQKGLYRDALSDFTKAIELNPCNAESYSQRGNVYLLIEENFKALADYHHAIALAPDNFKYFGQRALAYTIMGDIDQAKKNLESVGIKKNKLKNLQNELGLHAFSKGSIQKAIHHFSQFIELNPDSAIGYRNRGAALYQAGELNKSIRDYDEAIRLDPTQVDLYQMRAIAFMSLPSINESEESDHLCEAQNNLLTARDINPNDPNIYQNLATIHTLRGDLEEALECYEQVLTLLPKQEHSRLLKNLSMIHYERGEYDKALLNCEQTMQPGCEDGEISYIQGRCFFEKQQFDKAIQNYDCAVRAKFDDTNVYFHRAKAHFCLKQFDNVLEDTTRVLNADPLNAQCYQLRGLTFLAMHKDAEAYADFSMALKENSAGLLFNETHPNELSLNAEGTLFLWDHFVTSLDGQLIYKFLLESQLPISEKSLMEKVNQIDLEIFGKGLVSGLMEGGVETVKELGPFLANLLFHPIETTEELLTALRFLLEKTWEKEWETVFGALTPELKELYFNWDHIEDYQKGKLTGLFIGKNGMAALIAIGAVKTFSKLKNIVISTNRTELSCLLKKTVPEVVSLPSSELALTTIPKGRGWQLPYISETVGNRLYMDQPFVQIIADSVQNRSILEGKAIKKLQAHGLPFTSWEEFEQWTFTEQSKSIAVNAREIPVSVIEAKMVNSGTAGGTIEVALNEKGDVLTVHLLQKNEPIIQNAAQAGKILVRNINTQIHIMQPKHRWDKLVKITGNVEEDCKNVIKLLEDNQIFLEKYRLEPSRKINNLIRHEHQININGHEVQAIFNQNLKTGELFLNDAWVITNE